MKVGRKREKKKKQRKTGLVWNQLRWRSDEVGRQHKLWLHPSPDESVYCLSLRQNCGPGQQGPLETRPQRTRRVACFWAKCGRNRSEHHPPCPSQLPQALQRWPGYYWPSCVSERRRMVKKRVPSCSLKIVLEGIYLDHYMIGAQPTSCLPVRKTTKISKVR